MEGGNKANMDAICHNFYDYFSGSFILPPPHDVNDIVPESWQLGGKGKIYQVLNTAI